MKKTLIRAFLRVKERFDRVWQDKYPKWFHLVDLLVGIAIGIAFAITFDGSVGVKIGLFFGVTALGYLISLAFTYGIVRSRNGWTKK